MLTLIRAIVEFLLQIYSVRIASSDVESDAWDFIGSGSVLGMPISLLVLAAVAIVAQVVSDAAAHRLAHHRGRRIASRRLQRGHPRAGDRLPDLCRFRTS